MVGFTCSSFDLLHAGHVKMLEECSDNCDKLIVGLNVSPCKRGRYPVQNVVERYAQLSAIEAVDEIIPYNSEDELIDLLQLYHIDIRFIGEDYKGKLFTGNTLPIKIFYNSRQHRFSSASLKQAVIDNQCTAQIDGVVVKENDTYTIVDNTDLNQLTVSTTTLNPSQETSGHSHPGIEEVYTFLSGQGRMVINDVEHYVESGKTFIIPDGAFHKVYNNSSDEDLLFICVFNDRRNH
jgi:glycerol-3-phosphate cytidylyltransferase